MHCRLEDAARKNELSKALSAATGRDKVKVELSPQKGSPSSPGMVRPVSPDQDKDYLHKYKWVFMNLSLDRYDVPHSYLRAHTQIRSKSK